MSLRRKPVSPDSAETTTTAKYESSQHEDTSDKLLDRQQSWSHAPRLLHWHEIPLWQQDNEYILSSYRPTSGSVWISVSSLLYPNNQSTNIYSHLISSIFFLFLPFYFYAHVYKHQPNAQMIDVFVIYTYTTSATVCFACSAM